MLWSRGSGHGSGLEKRSLEPHPDPLSQDFGSATTDVQLVFTQNLCSDGGLSSFQRRELEATEKETRASVNVLCKQGSSSVPSVLALPVLLAEPPGILSSFLLLPKPAPSVVPTSALDASRCFNVGPSAGLWSVMDHRKPSNFRGPRGVPGTWNRDQDKPAIPSFSGVLK